MEHFDTSEVKEIRRDDAKSLMNSHDDDGLLSIFQN